MPTAVESQIPCRRGRAGRAQRRQRRRVCGDRVHTWATRREASLGSSRARARATIGVVAYEKKLKRGKETCDARHYMSARVQAPNWDAEESRDKTYLHDRATDGERAELCCAEAPDHHCLDGPDNLRHATPHSQQANDAVLPA